MKTFWAALVLAAITVFFGTAMNLRLSKISDKLEAYEDAVFSCLTKKDTKSAAENINLLSEYLQKNRTFLAAAVDHKCIDDIELSISELRALCEQSEISASIIKCSGLELMIRRLDANYSLSLKNIL